jgi:hypothetical protein
LFFLVVSFLLAFPPISYMHSSSPPPLFSSPGIIRMIISRRMSWVRHITRMGEKKCAQNFYKEPEGKIPLRRYKRRWLDNVRMSVRGI